MFYATGYRYDFGSDANNIVGTGGMYVTAEVDDVDIYLDEEPVNNMRIFRSATYIQNIDESVHRLTVQRTGLQTWVKDLPVFQYIVTEAQSFNMPERPQVRLVSEYETATGTAVVMVASTTTAVLPQASTTNQLFTATSTATSSLVLNPEYEYVVSLFASSTATSTGLVERMVGEVEEAFSFNSEATTTEPTATTTKLWRDVTLFERGEEVYAAWRGNQDAIPYYYCVDFETASTTRSNFGDHVYEAIAPIVASSSEENVFEQNGRTIVCRDEIRLDRQWQEVMLFDFFPGSTDLVLLLLENGLYVSEIDDRAWQNNQLLYGGTDLEVVLDGGQIFVFDGTYYFELFTELE